MKSLLRVIRGYKYRPTSHTRLKRYNKSNLILGSLHIKKNKNALYFRKHYKSVHKLIYNISISSSPNCRVPKEAKKNAFGTRLETTESQIIGKHINGAQSKKGLVPNLKRKHKANMKTSSSPCSCGATCCSKVFYLSFATI